MDQSLARLRPNLIYRRHGPGCLDPWVATNSRRGEETSPSQPSLPSQLNAYARVPRGDARAYTAVWSPGTCIWHLTCRWHYAEPHVISSTRYRARQRRVLIDPDIAGATHTLISSTTVGRGEMSLRWLGSPARRVEVGGGEDDGAHQ